MVESTCLLRTFSTPADNSAVPQQGNPIRVLGESISFGRFLSEGLDWQKWSSFSENRYVEEAEKFSKPGSVAAKKAYFEAHYKKKNAEKAAALVVKEANTRANRTFNSETQDAKCIGSSVMVKSEVEAVEAHYKKKNAKRVAALVVKEANARANRTFNSETQDARCTGSSVMVKSEVEDIVAAKEKPDKDAIHCQVVDSADTKQYKCDVRQSDLDISNVQGAVGQSGLDIFNVEGGARDVPLPCVDNANRFDHVEINKNITIPQEERMPDLDMADQEVLTLPVKGSEVNSSNLSPTTRAAKLFNSLNEKKAAAALPTRSGINKKSVRISTENRILTAKSIHMSINLATGTSETSTPAAQSRNGINSAKSKKSVEASVEKKRLTACSLYKLVNLPSGFGVGEISKTAAAGSVKPRNTINKTSKSVKPVGDSTEKRPTARSLHMSISLPSGSGLTSKMASKNPLSQPIRRIERLCNKSVSEGVTANAKLSSNSADCLKSWGTTKSNPRPPTVSSPFKFRSDERAIKRKAFLQRTDEIKNKEAEKVQLQRTPKDTVKHNNKKQRQSSGFKPKLKEDRQGRSSSQSNQIRETSITLPQSQKCGKKASSSIVQDKNFGNSRKPPVTTNGSKRVTEKPNRTTRRSVSSLSNVTRENASLNIRH